MSRDLSTNPVRNGADGHALHTDDELVRRWMRAQTPATRAGVPLWSRVVDQFCIGSTSAREVCARHGYDPDSKVRKHG